LVEAVRFRGLGQFRLRGLPEPISLYQVNAKGLAARFPPPRADGSG
jgi:class 3 adenylate cyclase